MSAATEQRLVEVIDFTSKLDVDVVQQAGNDAMVVAAARVSVVGELADLAREENAEEHAGLINYLMEHRHGTPFEHGFMTIRVSAPIMVFREWHRHRIGWSYNEMSGRYTQLPPLFYVPPPERPLVNVGSSARPKFAAGTPEQYDRQVARMKRGYQFAYAEYLEALEDGIAKEIARAVLGVGIYSTMYASFNPRSLMALLSLRIDSPDATFPSKPQWEIEQCALQLEELFADHWPITYAAWIKHGRVAP